MGSKNTVLIALASSASLRRSKLSLSCRLERRLSDDEARFIQAIRLTALHHCEGLVFYKLFTLLADLYNSNEIKEYVYLDRNDLDCLKSSIKMQQSGKGMNHGDTIYANAGSQKVTQGITGVDMEDEENATIMAAHKKYRGLGKDDLLKAIHRLRTLNVYRKDSQISRTRR